MKKILFILLSLTLVMPIFAQQGNYDDPEAVELEAELNEHIAEMRELAESYQSVSAAEEIKAPEEEPEDEFPDSAPVKKPFTFARQYFEMGYNVGVGVDNGLVGIMDFLHRKIIIDLDEIGNSIPNRGIDINTAVPVSFFLDIMNINIGEGLWSFGLFFGAESKMRLNIPKSFFTLITKGNLEQRSFEGMFSISGGVYANAGISTSAKYGPLKIGFKPAVFTPLFYIPKSGITYHFESDEQLALYMTGEMMVYGFSPVIKYGELRFGSDFSVEGEYAIFPILDAGAGLFNIPLSAATLHNYMALTMQNFYFEPENLLDFDEIKFPSIEFDDATYKHKTLKVHRPLRFDAYVRYKPLGTELLVVKPNLGFSVDINEDRGYFNIGLEGMVNVKDLFFFHLGTGYEEAICKQRVGIGINLRAMELDLEAVFRSQSFTGSFRGNGFGVNIGGRIGW